MNKIYEEIYKSYENIWNVVKIRNDVFKFYINGVLISTSSPHTAGNVNAQNLIELGYASEYGGFTEANIKIYNSLIYNRPLSDAEVLFNYNILKSKYNL